MPLRRLVSPAFGEEPSITFIGVTNDREWAWANYENVVRGLARILHAHNLLEVGGGRDPLFKAGELKSLGIEMTVNDISQTELDVLPASYHKACFDVAGDISAVAKLRDSFDLAFSRMVFEHVADGQRAWIIAFAPLQAQRV